MSFFIQVNDCLSVVWALPTGNSVQHLDLSKLVRKTVCMLFLGVMLIEDALKSLGFELNGFLLVTCKRLWVGPAICQRIQISVKNGKFGARCF